MENIMAFPLRYCLAGEHTLERLRQLYEFRSPEIVLARMNVPNPVMAEFARTHQEGFCDYPDLGQRLAFWDAYTREHMPIHDDSMPSCYLSEFDQGLYGGLFDGDVRFLCDPKTGWISSMVPPILKDWSEFDRLSFRTDHPWWRRYLTQLDMFTQGAAGKYGIAHFILINGVNFVFELLGATEAYMSLEERPEMVGKAIELAHEVNLRIHQTFFEKVPLVAGGTCSGFAQWLPGRIISESVDPFHMTNVDYFEKWGRGPVERIFAEFDGGVIHIHGNGRHLLEAASTMKGLKAIYLGDDNGYPLAFDILPEIRQKVGDMPLVCSVDYPRFQAALEKHHLIGGVLYGVTNVPDADTANRTMDRVRGYHR